MSSVPLASTRPLAPCRCEFSRAAGHDRLIGLLDSLGPAEVVELLELVVTWQDFLYDTPEPADWRRFAAQHNWRLPVLVDRFTELLEVLGGDLEPSR